MNNFHYLAKGDGESLVEHSEMVSKFGVEILKVSAKQEAFDNFEETIECVRLFGLLHDIGKCTKENQKALKSNEKLKEDNYTHNEIGYAFLFRRLKLKESIKEKLLYLINWHHGVMGDPNKDTPRSIIKNIKQKEEPLLKYLEETLGEKYIIPEDEIKLGGYPKFFKCTYNVTDNPNDWTDSENTFMRSCVISADRMVSGLTKTQREHYKSNPNEIETYIKSYIEKSDFLNFTKNPYNNERFFLQKEIGSKNDQTIFINAPAGFGKTIIPLLNGQTHKQRIIYVAPTNAIATSLYKSIEKELTIFGINTSIQLYLTGRIKKSNNNQKSFESDIIITNIDNFSRATVDNRNASKLFLLLNSVVVFDEYHEYVSSEIALFGIFINLMRMRTKFTSNKTYLLSATPIVNLERFWDVMKHESVYYPNKGEHYPAAHDRLYEINIIDDHKSVVLDYNQLIIFNSIKEAQKFKIDNWGEYFLIHSKFIENDKKEKLEYVLETYGKGSEFIDDKQSVVATHILQASVDISFKCLIESCISPFGTVQRIGRINRHGTIEEICKIYIYKSNSRSESSSIRNIYNEELSKLWFDHISQYDGKKINLNELYQIYNNFNKNHREDIEDYVNRCSKDSFEILKEIYPVKSIRETDEISEDEKITGFKAGSNPVRSGGEEVFYTCPVFNNNDKLIEPFTEKLYKQTIFDRFNDGGDFSTHSYLKRLKQYENNESFEYNKILKKYKKSEKNINFTRINAITEMSKNSTTPYIRYDVIYHPDLGVIDVSELKRMDEKTNHLQEISNKF